MVTRFVYSAARHVSRQVCTHNSLMLLTVSSLFGGVDHPPKPRMGQCVRGVVPTDAAAYALLSRNLWTSTTLSA